MSVYRRVVVITGDLVEGSGNFTTAHRIGTWFARVGLGVHIVHSRELHSVNAGDVLFVLGIHAIKGGLPCCSSSLLRTKPLWILLSGTDMNEDVVCGESDRQAAIEFVCRKAERVIAVSPGVARRYAAFVASLSGKSARHTLAAGGETLFCDRHLAPCRYIASAVDLLTEASAPASASLAVGDELAAEEVNMRKHLQLPAACKVALLVASIRAVKAPGFLLPAVLRSGTFASAGAASTASEAMRASCSAGAGCPESPCSDGPRFALVVIGPVLDAELRCKLDAEGLRDASCSCKDGKTPSHPMSSSTVVIYHSALPRAELLSWLRQSDMALNTSESEGQSNAILEAMCLGVPVAARNVEGNADLIVHGSTGLLFDSPEEGLHQCLHLCGLRDGGWPAAAELAARARSWAQEAHSVAAEAAAWTELLRADGFCEPSAP